MRVPNKTVIVMLFACMYFNGTLFINAAFMITVIIQDIVNDYLYKHFIFISNPAEICIVTISSIFGVMISNYPTKAVPTYCFVVCGMWNIGTASF